jgi:hypothetical protein
LKHLKTNFSLFNTAESEVKEVIVSGWKHVPVLEMSLNNRPLVKKCLSFWEK